MRLIALILFLLSLLVQASHAQCTFSVATNLPSVTCNGDCDAVATITANSGDSPYSYNWEVFGSVGNSVSGLCAGNYIVSVTDNSNCTASYTVQVTQPQKLTISTIVTNQLCKGESGKIDVLLTGGTPPYAYTWSSGHSTQSIENLSTGSYELTVWDSKDCTVSQSEDVVSIEDVKLTYTKVDDICDLKGSLSFDAENGTPPYDFFINGNSTTPNVLYTNLEPATYELVVMDKNDCQDTALVEIVALPCEDPIPAEAFSPNGDGINDTWQIENIEQYPNCSVTIVDRWGQRVFHDRSGYDFPWTGNFGFKKVPAATYYYFIYYDANDKGLGQKSGSVAVVR